MDRNWITGAIFGTLLATTLCLTTAATARAELDSAQIDDLIGRGMHDFYAHDFRAAHAAFSEALQAGSHDPRVYYFRGLCYLQLGRAPEARKDFLAGAMIEATETDSFYDVGRSLERIQGKPRTLLEDYRTQARADVAREREKTYRALYRPSSPRPSPGAPSKTTPAPAPEIPPSIEIPVGGDPVGGAAPPPSASPAPVAPATPPNTPPPASDDPFN